MYTEAFHQMKFTRAQYQKMADIAEQTGEDVPLSILLFTVGPDGNPFPVSEEDIAWGKSL